MHYIDVFNGDADGICALVQLRRDTPQKSTLVTGTKRDIHLLKRVEDGVNSHITVLDISLKTNASDVHRLLKGGARINYVDHHQIGEPITHPNLKVDIDLIANTCTSLIIDRQLQGKYREWALTAAFGDNLFEKAMQLGKESGLRHADLATLKELGIYINYNSYGANIEELFFEPTVLYQKLVQYDTPFDFLQQEKDVFNILKNGYRHDIEEANKSPIIHKTVDTIVIELPNEKWARNVSGVFGNELANRHPDKAHAILTNNTDGGYLVSVRAPLNRKSGADELVSQFPTGGGRKAAAGINKLPSEMLHSFIDAFVQKFKI